MGSHNNTKEYSSVDSNSLNTDLLSPTRQKMRVLVFLLPGLALAARISPFLATEEANSVLQEERARHNNEERHHENCEEFSEAYYYFKVSKSDMFTIYCREYLNEQHRRTSNRRIA